MTSDRAMPTSNSKGARRNSELSSRRSLILPRGRALAAHSYSTERVPSAWRDPCSALESSLHQLSPYIGKLKSSIAGLLVEEFTKRGDLIIDPFAGSGTVLLEAIQHQRSAFGIDKSRYAEVLVRGKLEAPICVERALGNAAMRINDIAPQTLPDLRRVPAWVRRYFHPRTLKEALAFSAACKATDDYFNLACLLGILHHQRPGFLSFPTSHLVPYLRDKKFPRQQFPELYEYRDLRPRLLAKVTRAYKRTPTAADRPRAQFVRGCVTKVDWPERFNCVITSPPYMNALDYWRDNRLRLWFADSVGFQQGVDETSTKNRNSFEPLMTAFADRVAKGLAVGGYCVAVVGDQVRRSFVDSPVTTFLTVMHQRAPALSLERVMVDKIPDVRRSRRELRGVRQEHVLILRKRA
ncbi:MAG: site-specific DNA-methyltransferase [Nitrososphaera sp.]|nr:site-specific DNA-methyltransferase [Nitrososphaera sp.]